MADQQAAIATMLSRSDPSRTIDVAASAARIGAARHLAAQQAKIVAGATGGARKQAMDLLFLLEESVLLFEETHAMLDRLATRQKTPDRAMRALLQSLSPSRW